MKGRYFKQPLFWCWLFVAIWLAHVLAALVYERWGGLTISMVGLLAALMLVIVLHHRRYKKFHPHNKQPRHS